MHYTVWQIWVLSTLCLLLAGCSFNKAMEPSPKPQSGAIRYVAVGDSYTIGFDVHKTESWPTLLARHVSSEGVPFELIANLGVSGYTTEDVLDLELPQYENLNPQFATLLIGANDAAMEKEVSLYQTQLKLILDKMQAKLANKHNLVLLTIPNFTETPKGKRFFNTASYEQRIKQFNETIREEAAKRNLLFVELEDINAGISEDATQYTDDGLHPSAKQYALWEKRIFDVVINVLSSDEKQNP